MKILQILPSLNVGGVERGVVDLARAMKHRGEETVVVSSGGVLVAELQKIGVTHYVLPVNKKSLFTLGLVPKLVEIIRRENIDVIHARSRVPGWVAWFASRKTGVPMVTTCHGYYSNHFMSRVMGWGKKVIVISRVIGRRMIDDFRVPPERIRLIHRGVDLSQFVYHAHREEAAGKRPMRIINVGRLSPIKGQLEFLKAVHEVRRVMPIEVWIVGSEEKGKTKYTDQIKQTLRQLDLESCVKLLGTRRDIPELLAQSDLLVLSTLVPEAFGRVVVEAGAVGTPVLATKVGGVLDIIDDGRNGRLVPPGDSASMAKGILDILQDRDLAKSYAARLREKVQNQFTLERMTDQTLEVYREVLAQKKILVIKLGAMGDLILAIPSLRMLRRRFPNASISLLVDRKLAALVSLSPFLNEVIPIDRKKISQLDYLFKLGRKLRDDAFDISIDLQNTKWTHFLAFLAGVRERFGFYRGAFGFLLNRPDRTYDVADSPVKHQYRILSKAGVRELDETLELRSDPDSALNMDRILMKDQALPGTKWIGLVIGSSPRWATKRWPAEYFRALAERLLSEEQARIVLIGSPEDIPAAEEFKDFKPGYVTNLVGKTSLRDLVALIERLDVLVTGDTAPLHIAAATGTNIVALFGPTDPRRHMPPAPGSAVLVRHISCQPCYQGECRNSEKLACLRRIPADEVFQAVKRQLAIRAQEAAKS